MQTFGYAALQIIPSMKGATKILDDELNGSVGPAGTRAGKTLGQKVGSGLKTAAKVGVGAAAAGIGLALTKGFGRLKAVDDATAKLRGLGYSGKDITGIMTDVTKSVEGTSFLIGDAAGVAAGSLAAGIKPGDDLERTLSLVGDAASFAGVDMNSMGQIFNKVASTGKLQGDTLQQLAQNGIPIVSLLADELGVSQEKVFDLASAGKIGFDDFRNAMETGIGGASQEQAKTFTGALSNVGAAIGRVGENLLQGVFPQLAPAFEDLIGWMGGLESAAEPIGEVIGQAFSAGIDGVKNFAQWLQDAAAFVAEHKTAITVLAGVITGLLAPAFVVLGAQATASAAKQTAAWITAQAGAVKSAALQVAQLYRTAGAWAMAAGRAVAAGARMAGAFVAASAGAVRTAAASVAAAAQTAAAWVASSARTVAAWVAQRAAGAANLAIMVAQRVAALAQVAVMATVRAATVAWTAVQWALNAALSANPIGLVVIAITALIGAVIWAWNNVDGFKEGVIAAWDWIKSATETVFTAVKDFFVDVWTGITSFFTETVPAAFQTVIDWISTNWPLIVSIIGGPIGAVVAFVVTHWEQIKQTTVDVFTGVKDFFVGIWESITSWVTTKVSQLATGLATAWQAIKTGATSVWNGLVNWLVNLIAGWVTKIQARVTQLAAKLLTTWASIKSGATNAWNGLVNGVKNIVVGLATAIVSKITGMKNTVQARFDALRAQAQAIFIRVRTAMTQPISAAVTTIQALPGRIKSAFAGAGQWLVNSGRSIIQGFINGIKGMIGSAVNAAKDVVGKVRDFFPFSPAKKGPFSGRGWVEYSGRSIGEGFADGIGKNTPMVVKAAEEIAQAAAIDVPGPKVGGPQTPNLRAADLGPAKVNGTYMRSLNRDGDHDPRSRGDVRIEQTISTQDPEAAAQRAGRLISAGLR